MAMSNNGLAKLIEECGEMIQVAGKLIAYPGLTTKEADMAGALHPDGTNLRARLEEEVGDVMGAITLVLTKLGLDDDYIRYRSLYKMARFTAWDQGLEGEPVEAFIVAAFREINAEYRGSPRRGDDKHLQRGVGAWTPAPSGFVPGDEPFPGAVDRASLDPVEAAAILPEVHVAASREEIPVGAAGEANEGRCIHEYCGWQGSLEDLETEVVQGNVILLCPDCDGPVKPLPIVSEGEAE